MWRKHWHRRRTDSVPHLDLISPLRHLSVVLLGEFLGVDPGCGFGLRDAETVHDGEELDGTAMSEHLHAEGRLKETGSECAGVQRHREDEADPPVQHLLHLLVSHPPETAKY